MTASVSTLPVWKKGASAAEWLEELAGMARENPQQWAKIVVVYQELTPEGHPHMTRVHSRCLESNSEIIAALEVAKLETWEFMKGRT